MQLALTIEETCVATGLGKTKLYEHIGSGQLKARKVGKRTLILKADLEEFLGNLQAYQSKKQEEQ